ncbi:lactonase family protein [Spirillospora sp. NPDC048911]|uniref:lactonase family protein n=1 Tax=Spirillospora sp. NPDC048911 TaxID=3364527 RepID=UPI0037229FF9
MRARAAVLAAALLCVPALAPSQAAADPVLPPSGVLYVTNAGSGDVSSLAIGPQATLSPLNTPVSTGGCTPQNTGPGCTPRGIALTPNGATAYVVNSGSSTLAVFRVGVRGALQPHPQLFKTGKEPWGATVAPHGRTLYVTDTADATISAYRIGVDGTPSRFGVFRTTSDSPKQTVLSPDGRFLYLSYANADESEDSPSRPITRYTVLPDGSLGPPQDVAKVGPANYGITMSPDGGLLYATSNVAQNVQGFRVAGDGSLKPVPGSPVTVRDPVGLKVTPDGKHLYIGANFDPGSPPDSGLVGFTIQPDGSLTPAAGSAPETEGTSTVAITPDGRDIFANMQDASRVVAATIGAGGTLKPAPGSPFLTGGKHPLSQSLAVRPAPATIPR